MKYLLSVLLFLMNYCYSFSQIRDTLYFDENWKTTTKGNHSFYRPLPLKQIGELVLIRDYYRNGNLQMQGYVYKNDEKKYVGDIYWYDKDGNDENSSKYINDSKNQLLTYYFPGGKIWKTIEYINSSKKNGKTVVFSEDGKILMEGTYKNGKFVKGIFNGGILEDDLYYWREEDTEENQVQDSKNIVITEKVFWWGTEQVAEEIEWKIERGNKEKISQKNYDRSGSLIQVLTAEDLSYWNEFRIKNGKVYTYYTRNGFAVGLKSEMELRDGENNGNSIRYYADGKIKMVEKYENGEIKEEIRYKEDGTVASKGIYKDYQPYEGDFVVNNRGVSILIYSKYTKGEKEGEEIVKSVNDSILARGIYKNGIPFQGSFVVDKPYSDESEIIQVKEYKKSGKQIVFRYNYLEPVELYEMKEDKREGETVLYKDGKVFSKILYKNDKPYEGQLWDKNLLTIYERGEIKEEINYDAEYSSYSTPKIKYHTYYQNNLPVKVIYYADTCFFIETEGVEDEYMGVYVEGKPYDGYFLNNAEQEDFVLVDYYEKGEIKYQYSNDYLANLDRNYLYPVLDIKSTFKNGKIFDGVEHNLERSSLISTYWKEGKLTGFNWDIFAMHYFNRIKVDIEDERIEISEIQSEDKLTVTLKNNEIIKELRSDHKMLIKEVVKLSPVDLNQKLEKNTIIKYYLKDRNLQAFQHNYIIDKEVRSNSLLGEVFELIQGYENDTRKISGRLLEVLRSDEPDNVIQGKSMEAPDRLTSVYIDEKEKPVFGILIRKNEGNTYKLTSFKESKIEEINQISIINIQEVIEKMSKKLTSRSN